MVSASSHHYMLRKELGLVFDSINLSVFLAIDIGRRKSRRNNLIFNLVLEVLRRAQVIQWILRIEICSRPIKQFDSRFALPVGS